MSGIVYKVHKCHLPEFNGLGAGSVWKCDCGKLIELCFYAGSYTIPSWTGWVKLEPRWFNEETQTPVPHGERFIFTPSPPQQTKWQKLCNKLKGKK